MTTKTARNSIPRSLWTAPSLRADRRRIYVAVAILADLAGAWFIYTGASGEDFYLAPAFWTRVGVILAVLAVVRVSTYALLVRGRAQAFNLARDRALVESCEITIDEAAERFASWPQRRVWHDSRSRNSDGFAVLVSMGAGPHSGPGFVTGPGKLRRLRGGHGNSYRWVDVNDQLRSEHENSVIINGMNKDEWLLPFPQFGSYTVPSGYAGRSRGMIAEEAEKAQEQAASEREDAERAAHWAAKEAQLEQQRIEREQAALAAKPVLRAYAGHIPPSIAEVLASTVNKHSEISNVFVAWSGIPGAKPKLTALVDSPTDRYGMATEVARALNSVEGGSKLAVRTLEQDEVGPAYLLKTLTFE